MKRLSLISLLFLFSCSSQLYSLISSRHSAVEMQLYNDEIVKYGLKDKDTLLDIGSNYGVQSATIFRFYPNAFFVLEDIQSRYSHPVKTSILVDNKLRYFDDHSTYVNGTADSIPLPSSSYRLILCRKTVHEFTHPTQMLKEIRRVMTSDGVLIVEEAKPKKEGEIDPYCKMKHLTREELLNLFSANGFRLLSSDTTTFAVRKKTDGNLNILKFSK